MIKTVKKQEVLQELSTLLLGGVEQVVGLKLQETSSNTGVEMQVVFKCNYGIWHQEL